MVIAGQVLVDEGCDIIEYRRAGFRGFAAFHKSCS
jgi:hypothetical protein